MYKRQTQIPENVLVSVAGVRAGTQILARDLVLPEGAELITDAEILIVNVTQAISEEALEAELAEAVAELAPVGVEAPVAEDAAAEDGADEAPAAEGEKA